MKINQPEILIVEHDAETATLLKVLLEKNGLTVVAIIDNGPEVLELVKSKHIDLILLAIELNGPLDGIDTAIEINKFRSVPIIYLTTSAGSEVIDRARQTFPAAFLPKICLGDSLILTIEIALQNFANREPFIKDDLPSVEPAKFDKGFAGESILSNGTSIFIKQNYKYLKINLSEISYLEARDKFTCIYTASGKFTVRKSLQDVLKEIKDILLIRVHRSFAVNMLHLTSFTEKLVIIGDEELPFGNQYKEVFLQQFNT